MDLAKFCIQWIISAVQYVWEVNKKQNKKEYNKNKVNQLNDGKLEANTMKNDAVQIHITISTKTNASARSYWDYS